MSNTEATMSEKEEQIIAWENLEMEQVAAISEAVQASNTVTVFWRYYTGIDADKEAFLFHIMMMV